MGTSIVRTIDQSTFTIDAGGSAEDPFALPWTGHIRYTPKYGQGKSVTEMWALELASVSSLGAAVESVGGRERERFSLAGGELVIFDCAKPGDARWAAWLGPWHMSHALFYEPQWRTPDIVETFSRLKWTDTPEGLTAGPGAAFDLERSVYLQDVPGVGTLFVEEKRAAAPRIPRWKGFTATAGEVWRLAEPPSGDAAPLLYVSDTAVATLAPWDAPTAIGKGTSRAGAGTSQNAFEFLRSIKKIDWVA